MRHGKWSMVTLALVLSTLVAAEDASAQGRFSFDGSGGVAFGVGELSDLTDPGVSVGGGIAYWLTRRLAVRGDFDANLLSGKDSEGTGPEGPDLDLLHYGGGLQLALTDPVRSRLNLTVNLGGGATTIDADAFQAEGEPVEFSETYLALNGGLGIGYDLSDNVAVFVDGQWYVSFTDEEETAVFGSINSDVEAFDIASAIPVTLGLRIRTD